MTATPVHPSAPLPAALSALRGLMAVLLVGPVGATGAARAGAEPTPQRATQFLPLEAEWCLEQPAPAAPPPAGCIQLEVPRSARQLALGLMERSPLGPLRGMWFRFDPPAPVSFWMHRIRQPLDLIYLRQGRVIAIDAAVPPCPRLPCPSLDPMVALPPPLRRQRSRRLRRGSKSPVRPPPLSPNRCHPRRTTLWPRRATRRRHRCRGLP